MSAIIGKKTVQKPVEISVYDQVLEILGGPRSPDEALVFSKHGDQGIKFLHIQKNKFNSSLPGFCDDAPGEQVFVFTRDLLDGLLSGDFSIVDNAEF